MKNKPFKANKLKSGNKAPDKTKTGINKKMADGSKAMRKSGEQSQWAKS